MKTFKRFISQILLLILWLMLSVLLWGFVFSRITETTPAKKITLCVDAQTPKAVNLAVEMEKSAPEGIRMVKVHPFTYAMLSSDTLINADLFIVRASDMAQYLDWFRPLPDSLASDPGCWERDGTKWGVPAYSADSKQGIAADCIEYEEEDYYLVCGRKSLHFTDNENDVDNAAEDMARYLIDHYQQERSL